jgi:hypothetical protein
MFPFFMLAIKFLDFSKRCHAVISFDFQSTKPVWSLKKIDNFFGRNKKIFLVANVVFLVYISILKQHEQVYYSSLLVEL